MIDQDSLLKSAANGNRRDLSRLLTYLEQGMKLNFPENNPSMKSSVMGITGPPGVGKSSLIGRIISYWNSRNQNVAVLAIDPSSPRRRGIVGGPSKDGLRRLRRVGLCEISFYWGPSRWNVFIVDFDDRITILLWMGEYCH